MQCVTRCDSTTQITINDTQFDSRPFCRNFEYYVNSDSDSIIELGTIDHPYKQISYAFIEILNYHSHSDRNLTIYLMEYTRNEMTIGLGNVINITNVDIKPYTLRSVDPDKATIVGIDGTDIVASPSTSFSIMKSYETRFDEVVTTNADIPEEEKIKITLEIYLIVWYRSSILLQNLELISEHENIFLDVTFVYPVYLQYKSATFKDLHLRISGGITRAYDPYFLNIENLDIDSHRNQAGFDMTMAWNYPEAALNTSVYAKNISFYYSKSRAVTPLTGEEMECSVPGDCIFEDVQAHSYLYPGEAHAQIMMFVSAEWLPDIDTERYYNITNANLTTPEPLVVGNFLHMHTFNDIYRITHVHFDNIDCSDQYLNFVGCIYLLANLKTYATLRGMLIINTRSFFRSHGYDFFAKVEMKDVYIENAQALRSSVVGIQTTQEIVLSNITINNNDVSNPDPTGIIHLEPLNDGTAMVLDFTVTNSSLGAKYGIEYIQTGLGNITIENLYAK